MNPVVIELLRSKKKSGVFGPFTAIYLFGSTLWSDYPNDVDLLLVYSEETNIDVIGRERDRIRKQLCDSLGGLPVDCLLMSTDEMQQTKFLERVTYQQV